MWLPSGFNVIVAERTLSRLVEQIRLMGGVLFAFVFSRLLIWFVAKLSWIWIKHGDFGDDNRHTIWSLLDRWDAGWYRGIAETGYSYMPGQPSSVNFFPLYPLLVAAIQSLTGLSFALVACALSNLLLLAGVICLWRLVRIDFPAPSVVPMRTLWLVLLFPVSFFFSAPYTESLFVFLSVAALLAARRGEWAIASAATALLTATHALGITIMLALLWEAFREEPLPNPSTGSRWQMMRRSRWWLIGAPLGLVSYAAFLYFRFGDPLAFMHSQVAWGRWFTYPWKGMRVAWFFRFNGYGAFLLAAAWCGLAIWALGWRAHLRKSYLLYSGAMLAVLLCQSSYEAVVRHLGVIFPLPLALAVVTAKNDNGYCVALGTSAMFLGLCTAVFTCGYWMT